MLDWHIRETCGHRCCSQGSTENHWGRVYKAKGGTLGKPKSFIYLFNIFVCFSFSFGGGGTWTRDFILARQALYHLSHSTSLLFVFETGSCYIVQAGLEGAVLLPQPPEVLGSNPSTSEKKPKNPEHTCGLHSSWRVIVFNSLISSEIGWQIFKERGE
jgi:hypothetical protein